jgi:geranyl-CoA carboxylase beta subunit
MPVIQSQLDPHSEQFARNRAAMLVGIEQVRTRAEPAEQGGRGQAQVRQARTIAARERLNLLLDPGAPFLELASLAGYKLHDDKDGSSAGGGLIAGIGYVSGVRTLVVANNSAIKGGTISPSGLKSPCACNRSPWKTNCR